MKKKLLSILLATAMVATLFVGCGEKDAKTGDKKTEGNKDNADNGSAEGVFAIVTKSAGNPFNEKVASGFQEALKALGYSDKQIIIKHPEKPDADSQITMVNELISQSVSAIAIAANDMDALQPVCEQAKAAGIKIISLDSTLNADSRLTHINQAGIELIGQTLMDAVLDLTGGEGQWAILSATAQASNQNAWIDAMKTVAADNEKYSKLELVEVAYGDDEYQKSVDQTQALLTNYPKLKVICAPTTVGIMAAGGVLKDKSSSVKLTGLGLPSEMAEYLAEDGVCPYMYLWNPIDLGKLAGYTAVALANGDITGAAGEEYTAGGMGDYEVEKAADGGTEVILGPPFAFTPENINEWKSVY